MNISTVSTPDTSHGNRHYAGNRKPLTPSPFIKLPLGSVKPHGWLKHQLDLMVDGMTGRLFEYGDHLFVKQHGWIRETGGGWEEQPYWFRGFYTLAALTGDERCWTEAKRWIDAMIALQDADGYFGPRKRKLCTLPDGRVVTDMWPQMLMLDAIIQHHEFTDDPRIPQLVQRYFQWCRDLPDEQFLPSAHRTVHGLGDFTFGIQQPRAGDMLPHIFWLYNITGDAWLLDLAHRFYAKTDAPGSLLDWTDGHNVNFAQRFTYPEIYWQLTKDPHHRDLTEHRYQEMMLTWGQPRGIFGGDEYVRKDKCDVHQGFETCGMVEMAKSFYLAGRVDGDPRHMDRCEDIMLNHFPVASTPDLKALHYLTATNQVALDSGTLHDVTNNGLTMFSYSPHGGDYRCCQHDVAMGWPWYAANLWQASADNGLALWLYSSSEVTARVGAKKQTVTITEQTDYPFDGKVTLAVKADTAVEFPLYLRVPGWCKAMTVSINGKPLKVEPRPGAYVRIERTWKRGDTVAIDLPMELSISRAAMTGAATVDRGPLSFSVRIEEEWKRYGTSEAWPSFEVLPKSSWNYGLVLDAKKPTAGMKVTRRKQIADQPWTLDAAPVEITVKAKKIPNWGMDSYGTMAGSLQESPVKSGEPTETIRLVPLGCARLRVGALPVIGDGPGAREWKSEAPAHTPAAVSEIRVGG